MIDKYVTFANEASNAKKAIFKITMFVVQLASATIEQYLRCRTCLLEARKIYFRYSLKFLLPNWPITNRTRYPFADFCVSQDDQQRNNTGKKKINSPRSYNLRAQICIYSIIVSLDLKNEMTAL